MHGRRCMDATTVDWLNALLCDELAAVETYMEALTERRSPFFSVELWKCKRSHEVRVRMLQEKIASLGGRPTTAWGLKESLDRMADLSPVEVDDEMVVRALAAGEYQLLQDYHARIPRLDREVRSFVERNLLPAEEYTHEALSALAEHRQRN
jgi:hypothetical protein